MKRARKSPSIALVAAGAPTRSPTRPWRRTTIFPSVDGALTLAVRQADDRESAILFFVQMSIDTTTNSFEELLDMLEDFSLRHFPGAPLLTLAGSGDGSRGTNAGT